MGKERSSNRSKLHKTIGLLTYGAEDPNNRPLWDGLYAVAKANGANLLYFPGKSLSSQRGYEAQANVLYNLICEKNVDGLVIWGARLTIDVDIEKIKAFCKHYHPLPIVNVGLRLEGIPSVFVDNYEGMCQVMNHLIEVHGYRRITFIRGPKDNPEAEERYRAYQETLIKHNIPFDAKLVALGDWGRDSGAKATSRLLDEQKNDFEAVVAANDLMALGALDALQKQGVLVPKDIAVAGFDDIRESRYSNPPLTTVRQPFYEYGRKAAEILLARLEGQPISDPYVLPLRMIIRQSCGCPHPTVIQAGMGITKRADKTNWFALAVSREDILSEIAEMAIDASAGYTSEQIERLLNALDSELKGESPGIFILTLDEILHQAAVADGDAFVWQDVISSIRRNTLPYIGDDPILFLVEKLCQQARVLIGEEAQRILEHRRLKAEQQTETLSAINQALVTTSDENELMNILADGLPQLGIPGCYVSCYENPVVPTEGCRSLLAYNNRLGRVELKPEMQHFPSWRLVPGNMLSPDRPYHLVVEPLYYRENQIGIAVFDVGPREGMIYENLRGQLSSALWGARLVQYLRALYEASSSVMALQEPQDILHDVADRVCKAVGARWVTVVLIDKEGRPRRLASGGDHSHPVPTSILVGTAGLAVQVMESNKPYLIKEIQNQVSPIDQQMITEGVGAAGCFPLKLRSKPIGVVWVYYEKSHHFPDAEVDALRLFINQAAIAYDNARRMKELEHLRKAVEKLASVAEVQEVLQQIVKSACEVLQADSAIIWSYDAARKVFLPEELVAEGVLPLVLMRYKEDEPRPGGTAANVIQKGYWAVTNVEDPRYDYLNTPARGLRKEIGVKSFQGIALKVDSEPLGVLYVNYKSPQVFNEEDRSSLEAFAYHAALALKKARLLQQVKRVHNTTRAIAELSIQENLRHTLDEIVGGIYSVLECDAVTLFVYNPDTRKLDPPPAMIGVHYPEQVMCSDGIAENSVVYEMLRRDEPYIVDIVAQNAHWKNLRFTKEEQIESCAVIPLKIVGQEVGVMFVNYRTRHHFTSEELADIELFAHQAAVAIRNAQLYEETKKRTVYLQTLYEAGKIVTSTLALDEILNRIVEQASLLTSETGGKQAHFCYLALKEDGKLKFKATYSSKDISKPIEKAYSIDLEHDERIGVVGRAVKIGQPQLVPDVTKDPDYIPDDQDTHSMLAVPIMIGKDIVGVIDVEHSEYGAFDRNDQLALEALAAQAAIAIKNAQQYDELKQTKGLVGARTALAWMGMTSSAWRHTIGNQAQSIGEQIELLRKDLAQLVTNKKYPRIHERLSIIQDLANQIKEKPITPPLSIEEGAISVPVNELIRERTKQLWEREPYKPVDLQLNLIISDRATVRASPAWLYRALDILLDNAIDAMAEIHPKQIKIYTHEQDGQIEILITDTGKGIKEELLSKLFLEPVKKPKGMEGLGMGLLIAQAIIQTYRGDIRIGPTSPKGTTMLIYLPVEE